MKRKLGLLLITSMLIMGLSNVSLGADHPITTIYNISAPFGTSAYLLSSALDDISKKHHPWLRINHSETPGLVYNIRKLSKEPELKKNTFFTVTRGLDWLAQRGLSPYKEKHPGSLLIANYNLGVTWLATLNPNIKSAQDLVGKKIALGRTTQVIWGCEVDWLIKLGWGLDKKIKIQYVGVKEAPKALLDGLVDAAIIGGYVDPINWKFIPGPPTLEFLNSGKKIYHIPWGSDAVKKTIAGNIKIVPLTLPAKTVKDQTADLEVFADPISWVAYPEFPADICYEITKMIIQNVSAFKEYHAIGGLMSLGALPYGWDPDTIHPGALRAYKEAGILK